MRTFQHFSLYNVLNSYFMSRDRPYLLILPRYPRIMSELVTTETEENAIAPPAMMGLSSHPVSG